MLNENWNNYLNQNLEKLKKDNLIRNLRIATSSVPYLEYENEKYLNFSSCDYLGLANHKKMVQNYISATTSSRLILGTNEETIELEKRIAQYHNKESALIFSNGYMANVGILSTILSKDDAVFMDKSNHASIYDGLKLSGSKLFRYRHLDMNHLENLLKKNNSYKKKLIITETIFSMDGDIAPLKELIRLKHKYNAIIMIDEAHSGGILGASGRGLADSLGIANEIDIFMGTFSKAYGMYGGYIATQKNLTDFLINKSRGFIYTTSLPLSIIKGINLSLDLVCHADEQRQQLHKNVKFFTMKLKELGLYTPDSPTWIIPIIIGDAEKTNLYSQELLRNKIMAVAIRPPTVPKKTSRIRFSISAAHTYEQLNYTATTIYNLRKKFKLDV